MGVHIEKDDLSKIIIEHHSIKKLRSDLNDQGATEEEVDDAIGVAKMLNPEWADMVAITSHMELEALAQFQMEKEIEMVYGKRRR